MRFSERKATKRLSDEATKGTESNRAFAFPYVAPSLSRSVPSSRFVAFSLIEVMIVIVIIGLMAGIVTYATSSYLDKAKRNRAKADISVYTGAVDSFYLDQGRYPDNREGLKILVPQFIKQLNNDPWGRPYQYLQPGKRGAFDIVSYGADGREGGSGADQDITNWDIEKPAQLPKQ
jgi:general secretion pathway protein G